MKRKISIIIVMIMSVFLTHAVFATDLGVTAKLGTLGYGADITIGSDSKLNARIGFNTFSLDINTISKGSTGSKDVQTKLDLQTISALLDWYPGKGFFRLSAGVMVNNNKVALSADVNETVEINKIEYTISDLTGEVGFNDIAPYAGIGYGNAIGKNGRWHFAFDLGVMFQGAPDVTLEATASNPVIQSQLNADIEEETKDIEDKISAFTVYPVIALGISYKF